MNTTYTFTVTIDGEVVFTKDKEEPVFTALEELELQIAESFICSYVDAEEYARKIKYLCLTEYSNKFKEVDAVEEFGLAIRGANAQINIVK